MALRLWCADIFHTVKQPVGYTSLNDRDDECSYHLHYMHNGNENGSRESKKDSETSLGRLHAAVSLNNDPASNLGQSPQHRRTLTRRTL
jgi:hypothetical protein